MEKSTEELQQELKYLHTLLIIDPSKRNTDSTEYDQITVRLDIVKNELYLAMIRDKKNKGGMQR